MFDFRTSQINGASFVYVLPFDAHHALVEHTSFTAPGVAENAVAQQEALDEYLGEVVRTGGHEVERAEHAGLLKASTGFAYQRIQRIQRDSAAIAESLRRHGHPFDLPVSPARFRLFDGVLLHRARCAGIGCAS